MDKKERIDRCLKQAVENGEIAGGCVLFIENGLEVCYAKAGWAAIESHTPIRRDTIFRLYFYDQAYYCSSSDDSYGRRIA